ncbi:hypothetical protein ACJIZ3_023842 [Penstemon smallii]|uniref:DDE Tnp4 domain-containing protein n=1 Tax=Penstemon smallii TaxID=265156 RepID=A0ABD3TRM6_9LAMI
MINGREIRIIQNLRMKKEVFFNLCKTLVDNYGLKPTRSVTVVEQVATFFMIVGTLEGNRHRSFQRVLKACTRMALDWIRPFQDPNETSYYIKDNPRYYPYFKVPKASPTFCTYFRYMPVDGTHIKANSTPSAIYRKKMISYTKLHGKYYLVDAGYPNISGFLAPYKVSYYNNHFETFNLIHSSIRTTIERTFGCWKSKFQIMESMPANINWRDQVALVLATMAIHNFIRKNDHYDEDFLDFERESEHMEPHDDPHIRNAQRHGPEIEQGDQ